MKIRTIRAAVDGQPAVPAYITAHPHIRVAQTLPGVWRTAVRDDDTAPWYATGEPHASRAAADADVPNVARYHFDDILPAAPAFVYVVTVPGDDRLYAFLDDDEALQFAAARRGPATMARHPVFPTADAARETEQGDRR